MIPPMVIVSGCVLGAGVAVLVRELWPAPPDLGNALHRLSGMPKRRTEQTGSKYDDRLVAMVRHLPGFRVPHRELDLVGETVAQFVRTKALLALLGLLLPAMLSAVLTAAGIGIAFYVPLFLSLAVAAGMWFIPDYALRDQAKSARIEFQHAAAAYLDLVALGRAGDAGPAEALERAAAVGDGWAFARIQDALARARVGSADPWDGLRDLAKDLDLPELADVADIIEMAGTEGAAVYGTLRARSQSLRVELLANEHEKANADSERLTVPGTMLVVIMGILLGFPAISRMFSV
ncbi:type II secretion system F family protein [Embleya sp. NPDC020630]|uniref:type II secretion system F family protein n=1 Tax=Embleya sp. NPDC020630 TaxID=3363979 RepID=UPI00378C6DE7